jgi:hypothetical protein
MTIGSGGIGTAGSAGIVLRVPASTQTAAGSRARRGFRKKSACAAPADACGLVFHGVCEDASPRDGAPDQRREPASPLVATASTWLERQASGMIRA